MVAKRLKINENGRRAIDLKDTNSLASLELGSAAREDDRAMRPPQRLVWVSHYAPQTASRDNGRAMHRRNALGKSCRSRLRLAEVDLRTKTHFAVPTCLPNLAHLREHRVFRQSRALDV
jgi:hypothetical protein